MNWRDAYEQKITIWKFWHTEDGRRYQQAFEADARAKGRPYAKDFARLTETQSQTMLMADPIFISAEMVELAEAAAQSFEPEPFVDTDLITPAGFALMEKPLLIHDLWGKGTSVRAIAWAPALSGFGEDEANFAPGILVSLYASFEDDDDYKRMWREAEGDVNPFPGYPLTLAHSFPWRFGEEMEEYVEGSMKQRETWSRDGGIEDHEAFATSQHETWRTFQTMFRLMVQKISTVETKRVDRAARRRSKRAGFDERDHVTVITLRRTKPSSEEGSKNVEWSHRWMVRGHWHKYWFPSLGQHRQLWISPYIKGPDDKELRVKPIKAWELVR